MEYAGFWVRVGATIIDTLLMVLIVVPALMLIYGDQLWYSEGYFLGFWDFMFNYILPAGAVILFWVYKSATPGKMAFRLKIVDAKTGGPVSGGRLVGRYLGYYVSAIPLLLGMIWVGFDKKKQGWHDKLAGTVVVRNLQKEVVLFEQNS